MPSDFGRAQSSRAFRLWAISVLASCALVFRCGQKLRYAEAVDRGCDRGLALQLKIASLRYLNCGPFNIASAAINGRYAHSTSLAGLPGDDLSFSRHPDDARPMISGSTSLAAFHLASVAFCRLSRFLLMHAFFACSFIVYWCSLIR